MLRLLGRDPVAAQMVGLCGRKLGAEDHKARLKSTHRTPLENCLIRLPAGAVIRRRRPVDNLPRRQIDRERQCRGVAKIRRERQALLDVVFGLEDKAA